jgi:hypothetical protein
VEAFLIQEGIEAGVIKCHQYVYKRNPNKWGKHLAPWFTETCRLKKQDYIHAKKAQGRHSEAAKQAFK